MGEETAEQTASEADRFAFISYSRSDAAFVFRLAQHIADHGVGVWFDRDIQPGQSYRREIATRLRDCAAMIAVFSPHWMASDWSDMEVGFAAARHKPILPLLLDGLWEDNIIVEIDRLQYEDVRDRSMPTGRWLRALAGRMGVDVHEPESRPIVAPEPTAASTVPAFPGRVLGRPDRGNVETTGRSVLIWQAQMAARDWMLDPDGIYGYLTELVCRQFQEEKGLQVDGVVGPETWKAAWEAPITPPSWRIDGSRILDE